MLFILIVIAALASPWWVMDRTKNANQQNPHLSLVKAGYQSHGNTYILGTDILGRDIFSRMMRGLSYSLLIGFMAIGVSLLIGTLIGVASGYFGGWVDRCLMVFINSIWCIPTILLVFAFVLVMGRGLGNIILAIGLTMWVDVARLVRGVTKKLKNLDFIRATQSLGYINARTISVHILPNVVDPLIVLGTVNFATAILVEAGISYLGFGIQPPAPSLGQILAENYGYVLGGHYGKSIVPALTIFIIVLLLNLSGNALRDHFDVRLMKRNS